MRRAQVFATATAGAILVAGAMATTMPPIRAQQQACLHGPGETETHAARRQQAIGLARQINTAQSRAFSANRLYQFVSQLQIGVIPEGFFLHLVTDGGGAGYVFSVKDTLDPCGFALFSDQNGLIYTAQPLR